MTAQLNTLIRLRQYEVDRGRTQFALLLQQERTLEQQAADLDSQAVEHRSQLAALSRSGQLNIDAVRLRHQYLQHLVAQRRELEVSLAAAQSATRAWRERLLAADQRLQIAEQLRERALSAVHVQTLQQEALESEESWRILARSK